MPGISASTWEKMNGVFATHPELTSVTLFGSRATGKSTPRSDFDLVTHGITDHYRLGRLTLESGRSEHTAEVRRASLEKYRLSSVETAHRHIRR
ncbi:MAG: nucleotidyltransferase domain-containing protein [Dehalococcoidia bacterium]|nr:nucleotidyltransferase domain-containing protein [Dehalococcoidia bacterium]